MSKKRFNRIHAKRVIKPNIHIKDYEHYKPYNHRQAVAIRKGSYA